MFLVDCSQVEELCVGRVLLLAELLAALWRVIEVLVRIVQSVNQRIVLVLLEVLFNNFGHLLVNLVILMRLQMLQVIQAVFLLHYHCKLVFILFICEVLLAAVKNVVYALKGHSQHLDILELEN